MFKNIGIHSKLNYRSLLLVLMGIVGPFNLVNSAELMESGVSVIHAGTLLSNPGSKPSKRQTIVIRDGKIVRRLVRLIMTSMKFNLSHKIPQP